MHTQSLAHVARPLPRPVAATAEMQLVGKALAGDRQAARAIYDTHAAAVLSVAARMVGSDRAVDVTQDAFVRAFARLHQFRGESALRSWLHRITVSVALNALRRERLDRRCMDLDMATPHLIVPAPERDPILVRRLHREIDSLPTPLRTVFVLSIVEGYTHGEIATILDVSEGTSKSRLSQARSILRAALADVRAN